MKKGHSPVTRVKNPEPNIKSSDWVIWAAWADRITFEEIKKKTGMSESEVIKVMRRALKPNSLALIVFFTKLSEYSFNVCPSGRREA